jgi:hypothetical protein
MTTQVTVVGPSEHGWTDTLARVPHDVHHLPGWSVASAPLEPGEPFAVRVVGGHGSMVVPFVRRPLEDGRWDAVSPYGYAGPAVAEDGHDPAALLRDAANHLRDKGCVSWFLRLHPILDEWVDTSADLVPDLREHGEVVSIDLALGDDEFMAGLRKGHRSDIRRGESDGVRVRHGDHGIDLATFVELHQGTMAQREAAEYHRFGPDYFGALADGLGDGLVVLLAELNGQAVAGALFTFAEASGIVGYHLAGSVPRPPRGATKLLIAEGRRIGRERGCTRLLLGGGLGSAEDALFAFKAGFSADRHRFRTLRLVLDPEEYARRCVAAGAEPDDLSGYFPAYRRG